METLLTFTGFHDSYAVAESSLFFFDGTKGHLYENPSDFCETWKMVDDLD